MLFIGFLDTPDTAQFGLLSVIVSKYSGFMLSLRRQAVFLSIDNFGY